MTVDFVAIVIGCVVGCFVMPPQWWDLAKRGLVYAKGTDGSKGIFVCNVVSVYAVYIGGSIAFI
jgi:hypothetical protein